MMDLETVITILAVVAAAGLLFYGARWLQAPRRQTKRLAMTVWAMYGPNQTAEDAEKSLRTVCRVVLGSEGATKHEEWIKGHAANFQQWEAEGRFENAEKMMRNGLLHNAYGSAFKEAFENVKTEFVVRAQEIMDSLNTKYFKEGGHRLETVKHPDGKVDFVFKKIWSDEMIKQKEKEDNEAILNAIGNNLLTDQSMEAKVLVEFLRVVYRQNTDREIQTPQELGQAWFACLAVSDEELESEVAKTFKVLNDAWHPPESDKQE